MSNTNDYATKEEVRLIVREEVKEDLAEVKKVLAKVKDDIIEFKDEILHEIVNLRDDVTVTTSYRQLIEEHKQHIADLEKKKSN